MNIYIYTYTETMSSAMFYARTSTYPEGVGFGFLDLPDAVLGRGDVVSVELVVTVVTVVVPVCLLRVPALVCSHHAVKQCCLKHRGGQTHILS